jgi:hypothetical protein
LTGTENISGLPAWSISYSSSALHAHRKSLINLNDTEPGRDESKRPGWSQLVSLRNL